MWNNFPLPMPSFKPPSKAGFGTCETIHEYTYKNKRPIIIMPVFPMSESLNTTQKHLSSVIGRFGKQAILSS